MELQWTQFKAVISNSTYFNVRHNYGELIWQPAIHFGMFGGSEGGRQEGGGGGQE